LYDFLRNEVLHGLGLRYRKYVKNWVNNR